MVRYINLSPRRREEKSYIKIHLVGINRAVKSFRSESNCKNRNWKCSFFFAVLFIPLPSTFPKRILRIRNAIPILNRCDGTIAASFDCGAYKMLFFILPVYRCSIIIWNFHMDNDTLLSIVSIVRKLSMNFVILAKSALLTNSLNFEYYHPIRLTKLSCCWTTWLLHIHVHSLLQK